MAINHAVEGFRDLCDNIRMNIQLYAFNNKLKGRGRVYATTVVSNNNILKEQNHVPVCNSRHVELKQVFKLTIEVIL